MPWISFSFFQSRQGTQVQAAQQQASHFCPDSSGSVVLVLLVLLLVQDRQPVGVDSAAAGARQDQAAAAEGKGKERKQAAGKVVIFLNFYPIHI